MKPIITPTIFVNNLGLLKERLELYEGICTRIQLDTADESFTARPTPGVEKLLKQATTLVRDVHLMTEEPIEWLKVCSEEGVNTAIGQIENMSSQKEFVEEGRRLGLKVGLAVDWETDLADLDWPVAKEADLILIMAVRAGKEKQQFNKAALERVKIIRTKGFVKEVCVDGGVNEGTIGACVKAGADVLAVGSCLWRAEDVRQEFKKLSRLAEEGSQ